MSLIKSISGIRGTIGGKPGDGLSPVDVVKFAAAFAFWIKQRANKNQHLIVFDQIKLLSEHYAQNRPKSGQTFYTPI